MVAAEGGGIRDAFDKTGVVFVVATVPIFDPVIGFISSSACLDVLSSNDLSAGDALLGFDLFACSFIERWRCGI
jgi:hypothetical protein